MKSTRLRANVLLAAAVWTFYVWGTRIWNILQQPGHSIGFKAVHSLLAVVSVAFGVALAVIGWRMRRESQREADGDAPTPPVGPARRPGRGP